MAHSIDPVRCVWAISDPLSMDYHDKEWGVPVHDDRILFEMLILEGAQAGLNWLTILKKRENYRKAFENFDVEKISGYRSGDVAKLLRNAGIIRNRSKIKATIQNAKAFLVVNEEFGGFDTYIWRFVGGEQKLNSWKSLKEIPSHTPASVAMSKDLRKRGFKFVGPTICYAFMQAVGMVNDHVTDCFRYAEIKKVITNVQNDNYGGSL